MSNAAAELATLADALRVVADAHRKKGETTFTVHRLDQMAATLRAVEVEMERLERWKFEATVVLNAWDDVWLAAGTPGRLGANRSAATATVVQRMREQLAAIDAYVVQLRQEGGPVCNTVADHLTEFLHPPVSAPETLPITHDEGDDDGPR